MSYGTSETKKSKVSGTVCFGINAFWAWNKGDRLIFRFKLKSIWSPDSFKTFFSSDIKTSILDHVTTSPDAPINCPAPMNLSLYEKRTFLLTILKQLETFSDYK